MKFDNVEGPNISKKEVKHEIGKLKDVNAFGIDGVSSKTMKTY